MDNEVKIETLDEQKPNKKKGKGSVVVIVILVLIILGLVGYIACDKGWVFSTKTDKETTEKGTEKKDNSTENEKNISTSKCSEISYDLKTSEYGLGATGAGISVSVDKTRKSVRISYNGATVSNTFGLGWTTAADTYSYELIDTKTFDKKISQVLIDGSGQSAKNSTILYLMEDGTVEYVPILKELNTNWSQQDNTKKFNSYGKLNGISDVISLVPAEAQGYHTVLAKKADGTVTNLVDIFKATGNFD